MNNIFTKLRDFVGITEQKYEDEELTIGDLDEFCYLDEDKFVFKMTEFLNNLHTVSLEEEEAVKTQCNKPYSNNVELLFDENNKLSAVLNPNQSTEGVDFDSEATRKEYLNKIISTVNTVRIQGTTTTTPEPSKKSKTAWVADDLETCFNFDKDLANEGGFRNKYYFTITYNGILPPSKKEIEKEIDGVLGVLGVNTDSCEYSLYRDRKTLEVTFKEKRQENGSWTEMTEDQAEEVKNNLLKKLEELEKKRNFWIRAISTTILISGAVGFAATYSLLHQNNGGLTTPETTAKIPANIPPIQPSSPTTNNQKVPSNLTSDNFGDYTALKTSVFDHLNSGDNQYTTILEANNFTNLNNSLGGVDNFNKLNQLINVGGAASNSTETGYRLAEDLLKFANHNQSKESVDVLRKTIASETDKFYAQIAAINNEDLYSFKTQMYKDLGEGAKEPEKVLRYLDEHAVKKSSMGMGDININHILDNPLTKFVGGSLLATAGAFAGAYAVAVFKNRNEADKFDKAKADVFESRHKILTNVAIGMATSAGIGALGITALASFPVSMAICAGFGMGARIACNITGVTAAVENFIQKAEEKLFEFKKNFQNRILLTQEDRNDATSNAIDKACQAFMKKARPIAKELTEKVAEFPSYVVSSVQKVAKLVNNQNQQRIA